MKIKFRFKNPFKRIKIFFSQIKAKKTEKQNLLETGKKLKELQEEQDMFIGV